MRVVEQLPNKREARATSGDSLKRNSNRIYPPKRNSNSLKSYNVGSMAKNSPI
jgi:hypothetical protein